jgi:hypothetical protein
MEAFSQMDTTVLLEKLIDIERFIGVEPDCAIRRKVIDIEDSILATNSGNAECQQQGDAPSNADPSKGSKDSGPVIPIRQQSATPFLAWSNPSVRGRFPKPPICA